MRKSPSIRRTFMSTAAVSGSSIFQELQSFYQTRGSDIKQLGKDLQSGDLSAAQQDFNSLAALGEDGPFANAEPFSKSDRVSAFNAVGEALAGGNLAQAQAAFATLRGSGNDPSDVAPTSVGFSGTQPSSAVSPNDDPNSIYQQLQTYRQDRKADISQLGQDLQAGNLSAAQQDFSALTALGETGPSKNGQPFQRPDRAQDFNAIGQALQSGDLAGAQSAFTSLSGTFGQKDDQAQDSSKALSLQA